MENLKTVIVINKTGTILSVDKNSLRLFGYQYEELVEHNIETLIPSPYREQHATYLKNYLQTKEKKVIGKTRIVEGQHKGGSVFPILLSVQEFVSGEDVFFIGVIEKLSDKAVRIQIDEKGKVISINENVTQLFGYTRAEVLGKNVKMLMSSPDRNRHDSYLENFVKGGKPKVIGTVRNVLAKHKDGTCFPISLQVEEDKESSKFNGTISKVDSLEAVFTLDENGTIISCNKNFVPLVCGYSAEELVDSSISRLIVSIEPTYKPESPKKRVKMQYTPTTFDIRDYIGSQKIQLRHKNGSLFPLILEIQKLEIPSKKTLFSARIKRPNAPEILEETGHSVGKYELGQTLGNGGYGKVKLAIHKVTKKLSAIKMIKKTHLDADGLARTRREIDILGIMDHPNIVKLHEIIEDETIIYVAMDYAGSETLLTYIQKREKLTEEESHSIFRQIASAVEYCHERNVIHRDIKHQNIVMDKGIPKLIDFGLSNFYADKQRKTACGTPEYAAPELFFGKDFHGLGVDIWSLGIVLYSMVTGKFPFANLGEGLVGTFKDPTGVSEECCQLIRKMIKRKPTDRLSASHVCKDPWVVHGPRKSENLNTKSVSCEVIDSMTKSENI